MIVDFLLLAAQIYLVCGVIFAAFFVWIGAGEIDLNATHVTLGFRLAIFPGTILLWPLLAGRWRRGVSAMPEERNAHRSMSN